MGRRRVRCCHLQRIEWRAARVSVTRAVSGARFESGMVDPEQAKGPAECLECPPCDRVRDQRIAAGPSPILAWAMSVRPRALEARERRCSFEKCLSSGDLGLSSGGFQQHTA